MKTTRKILRHLERIVKGFASHRRIEIIMLLKEEPELSLSQIAEKLKRNFKTTGEHTRRLVLSGLVMKRQDHMSVRHALTDTGKRVLRFLRTLE